MAGAKIARELVMARGWESKSVESQIEDRRDARPSGDQGDIDQRDIERTRKRESLESSRRGVLRELESATSDLRRRSLEAALQHLDSELLKLG
ncbi:MAG TPA: hypothetical protein VF980_14445 [Thermoanaerobaculia bacterium]